MTKMNTLEIDGKEYLITGYKEGIPTVQGIATTTENGVDADGNPVRSVQITVPPVTIGVTPGEQG